MKIVHFSDWHGKWDRVFFRHETLPEADLYICTGDMLPNFSPFDIEKDFEVKEQTNWLKEQGNLRKYLGSKDSPVVLVRGNHDFVDYGEYFGGEYFEVTEDSSRTYKYKDFVIGGMRGIPYIVGEWSDERFEADLASIARKMPDGLDILVTHTPPYDILDKTKYGQKIGSSALGNFLAYNYWKGTPVGYHFFGHCHCDAGIDTKSDTIYVNSAETFHTIYV